MSAKQLNSVIHVVSATSRAVSVCRPFSKLIFGNMHLNSTALHSSQLMTLLHSFSNKLQTIYFTLTIVVMMQDVGQPHSITKNVQFPKSHHPHFQSKNHSIGSIQIHGDFKHSLLLYFTKRNKVRWLRIHTRLMIRKV